MRRKENQSCQIVIAAFYSLNGIGSTSKSQRPPINFWTHAHMKMTIEKIMLSLLTIAYEIGLEKS